MRSILVLRTCRAPAVLIFGFISVLYFTSSSSNTLQQSNSGEDGVVRDCRTWEPRDYTPATHNPDLKKVLYGEIYEENVTDCCRSTLVSAYYNISSKHSPDEYFSWMKNFLSLKDCMVVFTTRDIAQIIRSLRTPKYPLHIIIQPLETLSVAQMMDSAGWSAQEALDHEIPIGHSRHVYWIWNEKTNFLNTVTKLNPFRSVYFAWLDIGALRHSRFNGELMMKRFPKEAGILLLGVGAFTPKELVLENGTSLADFSKVDRIGGGMIGGTLENVQKWSKMYYTTLKRYFLSSRFAGKDQSVMATTCLQSDICLILGDKPRWFLLQEYYMGRIPDEPKRLNLTK